MRALIVHSDPQEVELMRGCLESSGFQVESTPAPRRAVGFVWKSRPRLAVLEADGETHELPELCRYLGAVTRGRTYVVLVTRGTQECALPADLDELVDDYVSSPVDRSAFSLTIRRGVRIIELEDRLEQDRDMHIEQIAKLVVLTRKLRMRLWSR